MEFTYTVSPEHFRKFNKIATKRVLVSTHANLKLFPVFVVAWIPFGISVGSYVSIYQNNPGLRVELLGLLIALAVAVAMVWLANLYKKRLLANHVPRSVAQSVFAGPDGLQTFVGGVKSCFPWSSFTDLVDDEKALFFFLDLSQAIVIPKEALSSSEELGQLKSWFENSNKLLHATREARAPEQSR